MTTAFIPPATVTAPLSRGAAWARLSSGLTAPDVLILGGGVNGVGLLRDLAMNGVSAVLLDTGDFCSGASGASSRMAHGGLRYLEGREFRLVAEAARERNMLLHDAHHLVRPLEIVVPLGSLLRGLGGAGLRFFGLSKRPGPMSLAAIAAGLFFYERFGAVRKALPRHRVDLRRARFPKGLPDRTRAVVSYYDGQILGPEALVFEMLEDALLRDNVAAVNHVQWQPEPDAGFRVTDPESGETVQIRPRVVVNAAGAAIDRVNACLGVNGQLVRGVKGAHLVIDHPQLFERMAGRAFYFDDGRGRMMICLPVGRSVLMGTTEVETSDPADHQIAESELAYLLSGLDGLFEDISVTRENLIAVTSGIRPLQATTGNATQAARDHALIEGVWRGLPLLSLVGGKWTTFRSFAEQAGDKVLAALGRSREQSSAEQAYPGAHPVDCRALTRQTGLARARIELLVARYGAKAAEVARFCAGGEDAALTHAPDHSQREILWLVQQRMCLTLEDLILRRTGLVPAAQITPALIAELATLMAGAQDRGGGWRDAQIASALADPRILWTGR